jgi:hypothetical protein
MSSQYFIFVKRFSSSSKEEGAFLVIRSSPVNTAGNWLGDLWPEVGNATLKSNLDLT